MKKLCIYLISLCNGGCSSCLKAFQQFAGDLRDSEVALNNARKEWQAALEEAAEKRAATESGSTDAGSPPDLMTELQKQLSQAGQGLQSAADSVSVSLTLSDRMSLSAVR